jgi:hypothetical protein
MATYSSYRKVIADNFTSSSNIDDTKFAATAGKTYGVLWVKGTLSALSGGCCCLWTVPTGVNRVTFEAWGAGGNGSGACSCNRCHHFRGAGGGYYNMRLLECTICHRRTKRHDKLLWRLLWPRRHRRVWCCKSNI